MRFVQCLVYIYDVAAAFQQQWHIKVEICIMLSITALPCKTNDRVLCVLQCYYFAGKRARIKMQYKLKMFFV